MSAFSWSHPPAAAAAMWIVSCPCGILHTVDQVPAGGMAVVDCCCGLVFTVTDNA